MASVTKEGSSYRITWRDGDKRRRRIRIAGVTKRQAESIASRVQALVGARISGGALDTATAAWVSEIGDDLHDKLAEQGLVEKRKRATLRQFLNSYMAERRAEVSDYTLTKWTHTADLLVEFFGGDVMLHSLKSEHAKTWQDWLASLKRADNKTPRFVKTSIAGHTKRAKQFARAAVEAGFMEQSPFASLVAGSQVNSERSAYVSVGDVERVIARVPDSEWRLILALARYAGLRMPSEALRLEWSDIDWARNRMVIRKGKTKRREMPILPQLKPYLEDCFDPEETHVIMRHRKHSNWATDVKRFIAKAGLEVWPRLFHNMRASLETDLTHRFPIHVVTKWLGNSPKVAVDHYLLVREEDFADAVHFQVGQGMGQQPAATSEIDMQPAPGVAPPEAENTGKGAFSAGFPTSLVGLEGLEPPTERL